jgi:hypothetical protein
MIPKLLRITQTYFNGLKQRIVKAQGATTTYTAEEYSPAGIDSNPLKDMTAIYIRTQSDGDEAIIGYLIKNKVAEIGEARLFSVDENNALKFNIWCKSDGTALMGTSDTPADYTNFMVKFNEMKTEFDKLKTDYNNLVSTFNSHTHILTLSAGTGTAAPSVTQGTANTSNIDNAKNDKIKTN